MKAHYKNLNIETLEGETWKDIPGYEGYYQCSDLGRVKALSRKINLFKNKKVRTVKAKIKKPSFRSQYLRTALYKEGISKDYHIHKLVAITFLGHIPNGFKKVVNHINFIKDDNRLVNLEVVTARENGNLKHIPSSSKYTGVCYNKKDKIYTSYITHEGKIIHLGSFKKEIEAAKYYNNALQAIKNRQQIICKAPEYSSKYKGVTWNKKLGKWCAFITINNKKKHLGVFLNEIEAFNKTKEYAASY